MILIWYSTQTSHMHAIAVPNWHIVIQLFLVHPASDCHTSSVLLTRMQTHGSRFLDAGS